MEDKITRTLRLWNWGVISTEGAFKEIYPNLPYPTEREAYFLLKLQEFGRPIKKDDNKSE